MNEKSSDIIGQIVEADIASFSAGSLQIHRTPPLGALVKAAAPSGVDEGSIYAVVYDARTKSLEGRQPAPRSPAEGDLESFLDSNPHLRHLLRTSFDAVVVGHGDGGTLRHYLPPSPASIFAPVRPCPPDEVARFTQSLDFLKPLLSSATNADEVTAACLRLASAAHPERRPFLVNAGKELARLLADQPDRLTAILRRIRP
jgi:hypothetical protein